MSEAQNQEQTGANYVKIGAFSVGGAALGAVAGLALKLGAVGLGVTAGGGFLAVFTGMLGVQAVSDGKRLAAAANVRKLTDRAWASQTLGRLDKAEKSLKEALTQTEILGNKDLLTLSTIHSIANLNRLQKKHVEAESMYTRAIGLYEGLGKTQDPNLAACYRDRALSREALGQPGPALESATSAAKIFEAIQAKEDLWQSYQLMARCYLANNDPAEAITVLTKVKALQISAQGENTRDVISTTLSLARCQRQLQQLTEALEQYKDMLQRLRKAERPSRLQECDGLLEMAELRMLQGAPKDVEPLAITAMKLMQNHVGPQPEKLNRLFKAYADARKAMNLSVNESDLLFLFSLDRDRVRDLLRDKPELITQTDKTGWSPLQWGCFLGYDDLIRWLLRNGGNYDSFDASTTMGPIHVAAAWSRMSSVAAILEAGADINTRGPNGWTPVFYASQSGKTETFEQLVVRGADPMIKDAQGRLAVHLAAENGNLEIVSFMISRGLDKEVRDEKTGRTLLHLAAFNGHGAMVGFLLNNAAKLDAKDANGKTPADLAGEAGHKMLVKAMEQSVDVPTTKAS